MTNQDRLQTALWVGVGLGLLWLLVRLSPILSPFVLAGILAYICNPLVDRLQQLGLPRPAGVMGMLLLLGGVVAALILILLPLLIDETRIVAERLPEAVALANEKFLPWLHRRFGINVHLDGELLRRLVADGGGGVNAVAGKLFESLKIGGAALAGVVLTLLLTPVAMFYLLLDWHPMLERLSGAIPRAWHAKTLRLAAEIDAVLSEFLRGQLSVMLVLAAYYSIALWLSGLPSALPIGILTGLLIFVPYLGYALGLTLALLVAVLEFQGMTSIIAVLGVYGVGQVLESFLLTPFLVGERIGLHPLAVIFALMAFGQLFGFVGILIALPTSAALLVGLRDVRKLYVASRFYRGGDA